jgi:NADH-quinone oxidoreductase subunit L
VIELAWLIPLFPAVAFFLIVFVVRPLRMASALTAVVAIGLSFLFSLGVLEEGLQRGITMDKPIELAGRWLDLPGLTVEAGLLIDPLTVVMLLVVTSVSLLVAIYSIGYLRGDPGFSVFFAYVSLFVSSMLGLVVANNYFQMFFFWELVGLCSYLLIGFYFHRPRAVAANIKAFVVNRIGDFGFMLGTFMLFLGFGTFNFLELGQAFKDAHPAFLTFTALLIFCGPVAKSAQFPLHVWLPDAMEGPTPVSALIHAATMVAAGVYLLARGFILFVSAPQAQLVVAYIGGFTAFLAATMALAQEDIKRVLAYSTISQLGYMVMAMGVGSLTAGMFHLTTHAFFKALLFLAAGSIYHALDELNLYRMGGLARKMKITSLALVVGALALAGVPPFSGFWSKDEILSAVWSHGYTGLFVLAILTAFLTAFYVFRLVFVALFGRARAELPAHESPKVMTVPLAVLAVLAAGAGFTGAPFVPCGFGSLVYFGEPEPAAGNGTVMALSTSVALLGIAGAWLVYGRRQVANEPLASAVPALHRLLYHGYYLDELYLWLFRTVVLGLGAAFNWCERRVIDRFFDGLANCVRAGGRGLRQTQTGLLQSYALVIFAAVVVLIFWMALPASGGRIP